MSSIILDDDELPYVYFENASLELPISRYRLIDQQRLIPTILPVLKKAKNIKRRPRSLKNLCAHTISNLGISIDKHKIPNELLEYIAGHKLKHRLILPTFVYKTIETGNWKIGKFHNFVDSTCDYYIINFGSEIIEYFSLNNQLNRLIKFHDSGFNGIKPRHNILLRACPYIDLPMLNYPYG